MQNISSLHLSLKNEYNIFGAWDDSTYENDFQNSRVHLHVLTPSFPRDSISVQKCDTVLGAHFNLSWLYNNLNYVVDY